MYQCRQCFKDRIPEESINIYCPKCTEERKKFKEENQQPKEEKVADEDPVDILKNIFWM